MRAKKALTHIRMTFLERYSFALSLLRMSGAKQNEWIFHEPNDGLCELLTAQFIEHHHRCQLACDWHCRHCRCCRRRCRFSKTPTGQINLHWISIVYKKRMQFIIVNVSLHSVEQTIKFHLTASLQIVYTTIYWVTKKWMIIFYSLGWLGLFSLD